jgi:hypothetical protein
MITKRVQRGWLVWTILCALGLSSLVGCGGEKRVPVAGTVTLDGKPLNGVLVVFSPDTTKGNTAPISATGPVTDGHYELQTNAITRSGSGPGVPPGWYKVTVTIPEVRKRRRSLIEFNDRYKIVEKTPLEVEVKDNPEAGAYDFKLTK